MSFHIDQQTVDDLNIGGKHRPGSLFSCFNRTRSRGGERLLERLFKNALTDPEAINARSSTIAFVQSLELTLPGSIRNTTLMEAYAATPRSGSFLVGAGRVIAMKIAGQLLRDKAYGDLLHTLSAASEIFADCRALVKRILEHPERHPFQLWVADIKKILDDPRLSLLLAPGNLQKPSLLQIVRLDRLLAHRLAGGVKDILNFLHHLDVYVTVSDVARSAGMTYARAVGAEEQLFEARGLRHPSLKDAVRNDLSFNTENNVLFLTGANMAGKSTLMKAFGINVYLAHIGFPVAADSLAFSVKDGLFSSVNVADDISQGYSHYYAEVKRVKTVAEAVSKRKNLVVIFDELFKGTNVKDAFDATLAVTEALAAYRNSFFIISTHIIEVGECLKERCPNVRFVRLPSLLAEDRLRYTYILEEGITADRHGMRIIEQEGIIDLITPKPALLTGDR